jgi:N-acetyl-gamma-glutamyl-phosphate reductase
MNIMYSKPMRAETMAKVFVDGKEGTTGLTIMSYLASRADIEIVSLPEELRKDASARKDAIQKSDITILCLPDEAAKGAVALAAGSDAKIIDASTAHRTDEGWAYGFPELGSEFESAIKKSKRVAVPGCHASGVLALIYPLIKKGILPEDYPLVCTSLTGYSGGGKKMIAEYQAKGNPLLGSPRLYALTQNHKHLKEITKVAGLARPPLFCPVVADFYSGMEVFIPLYSELLNIPVTPDTLFDLYKEYYGGQKLIRVTKLGDSGYELGDFIAANTFADGNDMTIIIGGNCERLLLIAVYDNLRKGAAAAAVECLNLMTGEQKEKGL